MAMIIPWLGLHGLVEQPGCHISYLQGKDPINPVYQLYVVPPHNNLHFYMFNTGREQYFQEPSPEAKENPIN
jgi:hypothetical protein